MKLGGSIPVMIKYDISDEELYPILDNINGVFFTGGGLNLIDEESGNIHQYYKTAKKIFEYSKRKKDDEGLEFTLLGIC